MPATALVVELGRSIGSSSVAAGVAMGRARQLDGGGWVLLAELDPRGGDLVERLALGRAPRARFDGALPLGARELTEVLAGLEFAGGLGGVGAPARLPLWEYLVEVGGVPGVRVLLGDHLVEGASRAAAAITQRLPVLAGAAGASVVVIDGGGWTSAQPERLAAADIVYGVIQATSASQNGRCRAELAALWRLLQARERPGRLVGVVVDPAEDPEELRELFEAGDRDPSPGSGYRVVVLGGRGDRRLLARLAGGDWRGLSDKALAPFADLASPLADRVQAPAEPAALASGLLAPVEVVDEHAYLSAVSDTAPPPPGTEPDTGPALAPAVDASTGRPVDSVVEAPEGAGSGLPVAEEAFPDPGLWPFDDGETFALYDETLFSGPDDPTVGSDGDHDVGGSQLSDRDRDGDGDGSERGLPPQPTHRTASNGNGDCGPGGEVAAGPSGARGEVVPPVVEGWREELSPAVRAALEAQRRNGSKVPLPRRLRRGGSQEETGS